MKQKLAAIISLIALTFIMTLASCAPITDGAAEDSSQITIKLPPIASYSIRALTEEQVSRLQRETTKYRVTFSGAGQTITREGDGATFSATFPTGAQVGVTVYCLNTKGEVIVKTVTKTVTISSGANSLSFKLSEDGEEIIPESGGDDDGGDVPGGDTPPAPPAPVPGQVTYNGNGADSGTPSDTQTYETGNEVTLQTGEPARAGYEFAGWTSNVALEDGTGYTIPTTEAFVTSGSASGVNKQITSFKMPSGGVVLTAKWTEMATLYVSASGSPTNSGTSASHLTIAKAFEVASAYTSGNETTIEVQDSITGVAVTLTGGKVKLKLNSHTLTGNSGSKVIDITGGSLTLEDSGSGKITGGSEGVRVRAGTMFTMNSGEISGNTSTESGAGVYVNSNATFNMTGGKINNNTSGKNAGGVFVASTATFTMSGGEIKENKTTSTASSEGNGAGVYVSGTFEMSGSAVISNNTASRNAGGVFTGGTFTMSGGEIKENETTGTVSSEGNGGGVYVVGGTFEMSGSAVISNNTASRYGGGVYAASSATFTMSGGEIKDNKTTSTASDGGHGGGVYVSGTFEMSGSAVISNNTASRNAGGVFVAISATFTMSGGEIKDNKTTSTASNEGNGGGVYVNGGTFEMSASAVISNNTASGYGGGVFVAISATFTMSGGTMMNNKAKEKGGGVYVAYDASSTAAGTFGGTGGTLSGNKASYDSTLAGGGTNVKDSDYYVVSGAKFTNTSSDNTNWKQEN